MSFSDLFDMNSRTDQTSVSRGASKRPDYDRPKNYTCAQCGKGFGRGDNLKRHMRTVHTDKRPLKCTTSGARFSRRDKLMQHYKVHRKWNSDINFDETYVAPTAVMAPVGSVQYWRVDEKVCFFDLAVEHRNCIYQLVLEQDKPIELILSPPFVPEPAILTVSKCTRTEALPFFLSNNVYTSRFRYEICNWFQHLDPARLNLLRDVRLTTSVPAGFVRPALVELTQRHKDGLSVDAVSVVIEVEITEDGSEQPMADSEEMPGEGNGKPCKKRKGSNNTQRELVTMGDLTRFNGVDGKWAAYKRHHPLRITRKPS